MPDQIARIQFTQWLLERQLGWIAAADSKVAVVVAIDTAVIAALATAYASAKVVTPWALTHSMAAAVFILIAIICTALSLLPRTSGPKSSLVFFGSIAKTASVDYSANLAAASVDQLLSDLALQVHRNAEIAASKHIWVRRAVGWSFLAAIPWAFSIGLLVKQ